MEDLEMIKMVTAGLCLPEASLTFSISCDVSLQSEPEESRSLIDGGGC